MSGVFRINGYNQVRRINSKRPVSGGFSPINIAGLQLWIDFSDAATLFVDAGSTPVSADGDAIYQANDKSGNGGHLTQPIIDSRPLYKTTVQNGLDTSLFDDIDDCMVHPYPLGIATDFTIFVVVRFFGLENYTSVYGRSGTSAWGSYAQFLTNVGRFYTGVSVSGRIAAPASPACNNDTFYSIRLKKEGNSAGNLALAVNNGVEATNGASTSPNPSSHEMQVGDNGEFGLDPLDGNFCEYIVYSSALSLVDTTAVETYLNNKWAMY